MLKRESALEVFNCHQASSYAGIMIQEMQYTTKINLRGDVYDKYLISTTIDNTKYYVWLN